MPDTKIYYLSAPYSDPSPTVRQVRAEAATKAAAWLKDKGITVISPLTLAHAIAGKCTNEHPYDYDHNRDLCERMMDMCDGLIMLKSDGCEQSKGVWAEVRYMYEKGGAIKVFDPSDGIGTLTDAEYKQPSP